MEWSDLDYYEASYYQKAIDALKNGTFIDKKTDYPDLFQIGIYIVERADMALSSDDDLNKLILECLFLAIEKHMELVEEHIAASYGVFPYGGITSLDNGEVHKFWLKVLNLLSVRRLEKESWLYSFADNLIKENEEYLEIEM